MIPAAFPIRFGRVVEMPSADVAEEIGMNVQQKANASGIAIPYFVTSYNEMNRYTGVTVKRAFLTTREDMYVTRATVQAIQNTRDQSAIRSLTDSLISYLRARS